jgi:hypothetical protein
MTEPTPQPSDRRLLTELRRLAIEMVVGFVGVYAAFALSAYKDRRDAVERRHQLKRALIAEIAPLVENHRRNVADGGYGMILARFDSAVKAGQKPIPRPFVEPLGLQMDLWEATKQGGGLSVMDVPTFVKVSQFYNNWSEMAVFYGQLRDLSLNVIVPNLDRGPDAFYDPKTGRLRGDVRRVYYYDLDALGRLSNDGIRLGTEVIHLLARDTI